MKIAVLMSTYNGHNYLDEQMESLFNQTLKENMTVYIRDDGSTDDTIKIIEKWKRKINIILYKEKNVGPAKSFWELFTNTSIKADFYAFCDQDDIWDSNKLEKGIQKIKDEQVETLWCSNCRIVDSKGNILFDEMNKEKINFSIISQLVCGTTQGCAMMFNDALREYIINKQIKEIPMHDFVVMTYAIAKGKVVYDETPTFSYRVHTNNVVAKNGKNFFMKIKSSLSRWFSNEHRNEISNFANRILIDNSTYLDMETKDYINRLLKSRKNLLARFLVIFDSKTFAINKKAERSFKIRTLLGII